MPLSAAFAKPSQCIALEEGHLLRTFGSLGGVANGPGPTQVAWRLSDQGANGLKIKILHQKSHFMSLETLKKSSSGPYK